MVKNFLFKRNSSLLFSVLSINLSAHFCTAYHFLHIYLRQIQTYFPYLKHFSEIGNFITVLNARDKHFHLFPHLTKILFSIFLDFWIYSLNSKMYYILLCHTNQDSTNTQKNFATIVAFFKHILWKVIKG